jgi:hypothetical protein
MAGDWNCPYLPNQKRDSAFLGEFVGIYGSTYVQSQKRNVFSSNSRRSGGTNGTKGPQKWYVHTFRR